MRLQGGVVIENATCDNRPSGPTQKKGGGEGSIVAPIRQKESELCGSDSFFWPASTGATAGGQAEAERRTKRVGCIQANRTIGKGLLAWYMSMSYRARGMLRLVKALKHPQSKQLGLAMYWGQRVNTLSVPCQKDVRLRESQVQNTEGLEKSQETIVRGSNRREIVAPWR